MSSSGTGWKFEGVPGFGVQPSDEQLVNFYLKNKMLGYVNDRVSIFPTVDVCMHEPWDLVGLPLLKDQPWHFYSPPKKKYKNSDKAERTTKTRYWIVTGEACKILDQYSQMQIGIKKTLVFNEGCFHNGRKTDWVMNEYHPTFNYPNQGDFVLCKIKNKHDSGSGHAEGYQTSHVPMSSGFETGSSTQNRSFPNLEDQFSTLMSSNGGDNVTDQDESRVQAYMQELRACVGTGKYNVENTVLLYNQPRHESAPYYDGTYCRWP